MKTFSRTRDLCTAIVSSSFSTQLRRNMISGAAANAIGTGVTLVSYSLSLHYLGYEGFGLWLALATVITFAQLGNMGLSSAITKLIAEEYGKGDFRGVAAYLTMAVFLLSVIGTILFIAMLAFRGPILAIFSLSPANLKTAARLFPYIALLSAYVFLVEATNATLAGIGRMDVASYIQLFSQCCALTLSAALLMHGYDLTALLISTAGSYAIQNLASAVCIFKLAAIPLVLCKFEKYRLKNILRIGGWMGGSSVMLILLGPLNRLLLAHFAGVASIPLYDMSFNVAMRVRGLLESGFRALMPEFSQVSTHTNMLSRTMRVGSRSMKWIVLGGLPLYSILFAFSGLLLKVWLGGRYNPLLSQTLRILLAGTFVSLLCVPAYYALVGLGRSHHCFLSAVLQTVVNAAVIGGAALFHAGVTPVTVSWATAIGMLACSIYINYQGAVLIRCGAERNRPCEAGVQCV